MFKQKILRYECDSIFLYVIFINFRFKIVLKIKTNELIAFNHTKNGTPKDFISIKKMNLFNLKDVYNYIMNLFYKIIDENQKWQKQAKVFRINK